MKRQRTPRHAQASAPQVVARGPRIAESPQRPLTSYDRSAGVEHHVQQLLDWLVDEELRRWQREAQ
jgi:hypothetical protein